MRGIAGWLVVDPEQRVALDEYETAHVYIDRADAITQIRSGGGAARLVAVEVVKSQTAAAPKRGRRKQQQEVDA